MGKFSHPSRVDGVGRLIMVGAAMIGVAMIGLAAGAEGGQWCGVGATRGDE